MPTKPRPHPHPDLTLTLPRAPYTQLPSHLVEWKPKGGNAASRAAVERAAAVTTLYKSLKDPSPRSEFIRRVAKATLITVPKA